MNTRYLLHIGFPKTASTWLQYYLQESSNINYIGKHAGGSRWKSENIKNVRASLQGLRPAYTYDEVNQIIHDTIDVNLDLPFVLSDEVLAKPWRDNSNWATEFSKRLYRYFPEGEVLLTVRKQSDIACSLYRKYVEENGLQSLNMKQWFESGAGSNDIDFWKRWDCLDYYQGLMNFFDGRITVVPYEMTQSFPENYCSIINDFFGIDDVDLSIKKRVNKVSFDTDYVQVLKMLARPRYWGGIKQAIKIKPKYDERLIQLIDDGFEKNNRQFAQIANLDLQSYGYY